MKIPIGYKMEVDLTEPLVREMQKYIIPKMKEAIGGVEKDNLRIINAILSHVAKEINERERLDENI